MERPHKNTLKDKDFYSNNDESSLNKRPSHIRYEFPSMRSLIKMYPDLDKKLQLALKGRSFMLIDKYSKSTMVTFENDPVKFLEENNLNVILHDSRQQSWLKTSVQEWKSLIDYFHREFFCAIFNEEDFSKTYVCATKADSENIFSRISDFLLQRPRDIKIPPHFREFMRHNKKFSHLKVEETAQDGIWIRNISEPLFLKLKEEIRNVICQNYLLDKNKYELLPEMKNKMLSNIENKLQVKSNVFSASIPLALEVNPLTNVSCILKEESGIFAVDNLIILDSHKPSNDFILDSDMTYYKIWQKVPLDIPANLIVYAEISSKPAEPRLGMILEDCLRKIYSSPSPVVVLGILPCSQVIQDWEAFFDCLMSTVEHLREEQVQLPHHHIMLIAENNEMLAQIKRLFSSKISFAKEVEKRHSFNFIEGDLTDQKVDVIVNSTHASLDLTKGEVSKVLLKKAGPDIQRECKRKHPNGLPYLQLCLTKGYNLPCRYVIHGVLPSYKKSVISKFVTDCLEKSAQCKFSSIAFPALGTGILQYPPDEVAKEMKEGIETFSKKHPNHGLEIRIVLFPGQPEIKKSFSNMMLNLGNVPSNLSSNTKDKWLKSYQNKMLHWIQFVNYSNEPENLKLGLSTFLKDLQKVPFIIHSVFLEQLLFFTNIFQLVPDIIAQYSEEKIEEVRLLVPAENLSKLTNLVEEAQKKVFFTEELKTLVKLTNKQVELVLQIIRKQYPDVKCQCFENGQMFSFHSLVDNSKQAQHLLKYLLSFIETSPINENQFSVDRPEPEKIITDSEIKVHIEQEKVKSPASNSKKNEDTDGFQIADDFFIKVYQGDLLNLNVDGIVNIADNWLSFENDIFKAAGYDLRREYSAKTKGKSLNNGSILTTSAGNIKQYKNIIHVVGLMHIKASANEYSKIKLTETVCELLTVANGLGLRSVALPAIISDIYPSPNEVCKGYVMGVMEFFKRKEPNCQLKEVHLVSLNPVVCTSISNYCTEIRKDYIDQSKENSENISNQKKLEYMDVDPTNAPL